MQVVRAHQRRRYVTVEDTRRAVQEAALRSQRASPDPRQQLAAKLEKMTGYSIAELAVQADQWPDV
jgi:hypothetical protein